MLQFILDKLIDSAYPMLATDDSLDLADHPDNLEFCDQLGETELQGLFSVYDEDRGYYSPEIRLYRNELAPTLIRNAWRAGHASATELTRAVAAGLDAITRAADVPVRVGLSVRLPNSPSWPELRDAVFHTTTPFEAGNASYPEPPEILRLRLSWLWMFPEAEPIFPRWREVLDPLRPEARTHPTCPPLDARSIAERKMSMWRTWYAISQRQPCHPSVTRAIFLALRSTEAQPADDRLTYAVGSWESLFTPTETGLAQLLTPHDRTQSLASIRAAYYSPESADVASKTAISVLRILFDEFPDLLALSREDRSQELAGSPAPRHV